MGWQRGCSWAGDESLFKCISDGFPCEDQTLGFTGGVITHANPIRRGVLWHLFLFSRTALSNVHRGLANQDGKQGMGGQIDPFSCQCCPSSTSTRLSVPTIAALPFVLPSFIFIAQSLCPSGCRRVRWGHWTLPPPHAEASASSCGSLLCRVGLLWVSCTTRVKKKRP